MPRRSILSAAERASLLLPPNTEDELIRHYAFGETDLSLIRQRRGDANRLGVALQLCLLRFPGQGLLPDASMPMSDDFDFLHRIGESYATLRRYAPEFLDVLKLRAAPTAKDVLDAIEVLRGMNSDNARKVPADAPTGFIKPRWQKLVMTDAGIDRRYYELCALSELKNSLRSGDIWVQGSRQFKDFEDYLVPPEKFASLKQSSALPLAVATDCDQYLHDRLTLLETQLATVNRMALANELPDAIITESGLKITPLDAAVPDTAQDTGASACRPDCR